MPKGSKVLMADDDTMLLDMYKERLELAGYVVESHGNGQELIEHVRDFNPDIIMLDVMMPKMNGYEALAALKADPVNKLIPVVMLSALMRDFNREKAVDGGAEDYLIKSEAMPSDVITKIEQVLQKYGKGASPVASAANHPATVQPVKEAVFEPASQDSTTPTTSVNPTAENSIETQPQVSMPKVTSESTPVQPTASVEKKPEEHSNTGLIITLVVIVVLLAVAFYFLFFKK